MTDNKLAQIIAPIGCCPLASRTSINNRTIVHPELGFPHRGAVSTRGSLSWFPVCWRFRDMEGFLIRGWDHNVPASGATSTLVRGATLAAHWLNEPQPISNQLVWLGFSLRAGRYRPGGSPFSSPGCWSCRNMEGFMIRGRDPILPGCGGTSTLS